MKVTYIGHSGFLVETDIANLLFDYSKGQIPDVNHDLPFIVFVSHKHGDHYNPEIFTLAKKYKNIQFFISNDTDITESVRKEYKLSQSFLENKVTFVAHGIRRIISLSGGKDENDYIMMETIKSTDQGIAFLLNVRGQRIYHAGDLNCWVWEDDTKQEFNNMSALFKRAIEQLNGREIYLALAPLDPRQGRYYKLSMDYLLNAVPVKYAVPMHLWEEYGLVDRYEEERSTKYLPTKILKLTQQNNSVDI